MASYCRKDCQRAHRKVNHKLKKDYAEAVRWWYKAAEQGAAEAKLFIKVAEAIAAAKPALLSKVLRQLRRHAGATKVADGTPLKPCARGARPWCTAWRRARRSTGMQVGTKQLERRPPNSNSN